MGDEAPAVPTARDAVHPLSIQKKSTRQSLSEKEKPSWFNEVQLGGSSYYGQAQGLSQRLVHLNLKVQYIVKGKAESSIVYYMYPE